MSFRVIGKTKYASTSTNDEINHFPSTVCANYPYTTKVYFLAPTRRTGYQSVLARETQRLFVVWIELVWKRVVWTVKNTTRGS